MMYALTEPGTNTNLLVADDVGEQVRATANRSVLALVPLVVLLLR